MKKEIARHSWLVLAAVATRRVIRSRKAAEWIFKASALLMLVGASSGSVALTLVAIAAIVPAMNRLEYFDSRK